MDAYERSKTVRANVKAAGRCDIPASARAVLKVLAEHANPDGTHAFPSVAIIAQQGSRGRKTVQRWLRWLVDEEYIEERGINRKYRTMEYALNLDLIYDNPLPRPRKRAWCPRWVREEVIEEFGQWCPFCLETGDATYGPDGKRWNIILVDHRWRVRECLQRRSLLRHLQPAAASSSHGVVRTARIRP